MTAIPWVPMSSVSGDLPTDDERWAFEPKWDGMRALVEVDPGGVRGWSRAGKSVDVSFPELRELAALGASLVLDGELVSVDEAGRSDFGRLQRRFGVTDPHEAALRAREVPAVYVVFDVLRIDGIECLALPFSQRRELLTQLVEPGPTWQVTASGVGHGEAWVEAARVQHLEGVMAKRLDRPYEPGRRSASWRKIKVRHAQEFVVCGWTRGAGRREHSLGALVLGCHGDAGLRWVGNVGTGLTDVDVAWWRDELEASRIDDCPFADPVAPNPALRQVQWATPQHVVQVAYAEWTNDRRLRQPSLLGRRFDVDPAEVRCEE